MARLFFYLLLVCLAAFFSTSFLAGMVGGTLPVSFAPCLALFFLTRVSLRLPAVWIVVSAFFLELFSTFPLGMQAMAFLCAAVFLRTMLLTLITHRSRIALSLAGVATAVVYYGILLLLHLFFVSLFHITPFLTFSVVVQGIFWQSVLFALMILMSFPTSSRTVYGTT